MVYWTGVVLGVIALLMAVATVVVLLTRRGNSTAQADAPAGNAQTGTANQQQQTPAPKKRTWWDYLGTTAVVVGALIALSISIQIGSWIWNIGSEEKKPVVSQQERANQKVRDNCVRTNITVTAPGGKNEAGEWIWSDPLKVYNEEASPRFLLVDWNKGENPQPVMLRYDDGTEYFGTESPRKYTKTIEFRSVDEKPVKVPVSYWTCIPK